MSEKWGREKWRGKGGGGGMSEGGRTGGEGEGYCCAVLALREKLNSLSKTLAKVKLEKSREIQDLEQSKCRTQSCARIASHCCPSLPALAEMEKQSKVTACMWCPW